MDRRDTMLREGDAAYERAKAKAAYERAKAKAESKDRFRDYARKLQDRRGDGMARSDETNLEQDEEIVKDFILRQSSQCGPGCDNWDDHNMGYDHARRCSCGSSYLGIVLSALDRIVGAATGGKDD
jgi:hypothetical protein